MFSKIDFKKYSESRKKYYETLSSFVIDPSMISKPIKIDSSFFARIDKHLKKFLDRRLESKKFTKAENEEYKALLKKWFPELLPIFDHKGPTIYWFKINYSEGLTNEKILAHYSSIKGSGTGWWTKVNLIRRNSKSEILYLGKINVALENRFIQHLGLGHNFTTALKLQRWMPTLKGMSLDYQFLKLDNSMKKYTEDIEKVLWDDLQPLLGQSPRF
jgi:hypothetical protein